jgi:hypothetical protein
MVAAAGELDAHGLGSVEDLLGQLHPQRCFFGAMPSDAMVICHCQDFEFSRGATKGKIGEISGAARGPRPMFARVEGQDDQNLGVLLRWAE